MSTNLPRSERPRKQSADKTPRVASDNPTQSAHGNVTELPLSAPKVTREQRYSAPAGRHSQQTQRRARELAAAGGHATEKEQLAHERTVVEAEFIQRTQQRLKQREQKTPQKPQAAQAAPASKPAPQAASESKPE